MNHLTNAEAELLRLTASPRSPESNKRMADLRAIIAEHRIGNAITAFR
jgi:hypothetical protein